MMSLRPHSHSADTISAAIVLSSLLLAACGTPVVSIQLTLATRACGASSGPSSFDPVAGVDTLHFKITGDGISAIALDTPFSTGAAQLPNIPLGANRRIVVSALVKGQVRARADSGPFDVLGPDDVHLTLFLRVLDAFTPSAGISGGACSRMSTTRAGHSMVQLPDGRVLITGGFSLDGNGLLHYHADAEFFDPATGLFSAAAASPQLARSGHAALPVQLGGNGPGILLIGGEGQGAGSSATAVRPLDLFENGAWMSPALPALPESPAREHAAAAVDLKTGDVVIAGGQSGPDGSGPTVFDSVSWFDPQQQIVHDAGARLVGRLTDAVAVPRINQPRGGAQLGGIVLVGGRDATGAALAQVSGLVFSEAQHDYVLDGSLGGLVLPSPRVKHGAVRLLDDTILVAGGLTQSSSDYANATAAVTIVDPGKGTALDVAQLSVARGDACTVLLEDGEVLVAGGAASDANQLLASSSTAEIIAPAGPNQSVTSVRLLQGPTTGAWGLRDSRHRAACLRLRDGSVLVTGGLQYQAGGGVVALDSAEIYTPASAR